MTTFVLLPGAGGAGAVYWRLVVEELVARGHEARAVDIDGPDPRLGLPEYADAVDEVIGDAAAVVLVAQSMGGFTAPMIGRVDQVSRIVLLNAMIPLPGETPGQWFAATGAENARREAELAAGRSGEFDVEDAFLHDVPDRWRAELAEGDREPSATPFGQPCTFDRWPDVPLHVLSAAGDRFFPLAFQRRQARERLALDADVIDGGHLVARSRPVELTERLLAYPT